MGIGSLKRAKVYLEWGESRPSIMPHHKGALPQALRNTVLSAKRHEEGPVESTDTPKSLASSAVAALYSQRPPRSSIADGFKCRFLPGNLD